MSEGPVNFGKPLFFLVALGCGAGGYYLWSHWPVTWEDKSGGNYASVNFPHGWTIGPADPANPTKVVARGPLMEEVPGVGTFELQYHGTLDWPNAVFKFISGSPDVQAETEIDHKKSETFEFQDNDIRYMGAGVDRVDALVIVTIGCAKAEFDANRKTFEKVIKSIKCSR